MNILLEGPPGTGKTSTIFMLASHLNLSISIPRFTMAFFVLIFCHERVSAVSNEGTISKSHML